MPVSKYVSSSQKYVIITPVRNEADYIQKTIDSVANQIVKPIKWVIVDDGSTDKTPQIIAEAVKIYPWIIALQRKDRGYRKPGGGVVEAFYEGYSALPTIDWDFLVKLDADLSFDAKYFNKCLTIFDKESKSWVLVEEPFMYFHKWPIRTRLTKRSSFPRKRRYKNIPARMLESN